MAKPDDILNALRNVQDPELHKDLVALDMVKDIVCDGAKVSFKLNLTTPACPLKDRLLSEAKEAVLKIPGVKYVQVDFIADVRRSPSLAGGKVLPSGIRNVIAVASGKGGVGKSTVAVNLAVSLSKTGARVGLLDADIYGPNVPMMMGIRESERPSVTPQKQLIPFENHGVKVISIGFLVEPGKPIIWRGPMLHGVIRQFLSSVQWGELDYLIVDLPPGTGDAPLSLVQSTPLSGAVIVTTPQEVALSDVRRSIGMFNEVRVPILGVIENMSGLICPHCSKNIEIYHGEGGKLLSEEFEAPLLGKIPFSPSVGLSGDSGTPIVISEPGSPQAKALFDAAEKTAARISVLNAGVPLTTASPSMGEAARSAGEGEPLTPTLSNRGRGSQKREP
jgi:ATP-binding protein involved in chromosome partitioning